MPPKLAAMIGEDSMKKLSIAVSLLLLCSVASAQSLASVAKKERQRREANRKAGVEAVEMRQIKPGLGSTEAASEVSETTRTPGVSPVETFEEEESSRAIKEEEIQPDPWDAIFREHLDRYRSVANEIEQLKAEQAEICKDRNPSPAGVAVAPEGATLLNVPTEQQNRCATIPGWLLRLEIELKQIEHDCTEDARRRGIVPGRARLYR